MTPPFLMGGALVFWGWQSQYFVTGLVLAVIFESSRLVKDRWDFSDADLTRLWAFCSLLLVASALYAFTSNDGQAELQGFIGNPSFFTGRGLGNSTARAASSWLRWLPMVFFPFAAAQAYSSREGVPLHTISLILSRRRKKARQLGRAMPPDRLVNIGYAYFAMCLFAAGVHGGGDESYFWGVSVLAAWALWQRRGRRYHPALWAVSMALAVGFGYGGQRGLGALQRYLEGLNPDWLNHFGHARFDATQSKTTLGQIGQRKTSGKIVIRLEATNGMAPPLLRSASYHLYKVQTWYADPWQKGFEQVQEGPTHTWMLLSGRTNQASVNIGCYLDGGADLLPLPSGSSELDNLWAYTLAENRLGAVFAKGPGLVVFDALFGPGATRDSAARPEDREVPPLEKPGLDQVAARLALAGKTREETLSAVGGFFRDNFTYSTWQEPGPAFSTNETPLRRFLLSTRSGHCEYFATATVLLLRTLGIPARYAVGFAVHEQSGKKYVVRASDAHAWCLVWDDVARTWVDFDTTPGTWVEAEAKRASPLRFLSDLWSRLWYEFSRFRWGQGQIRQYLLWLLVPVLLYLLYQIIFRSRSQRRRGGPEGKGAESPWPGLDSDFYRVEAWIAERGVARRPGEPVSEWLKRAVAEPGTADLQPSLQELMHLHYRYRFDPRGLSAVDREALARKAAACLQNLQQAIASPARR